MREWFEATSSVVMGRLMYDSGVEFWGDNPPFHTPVFVLTNRPAHALEPIRVVDTSGATHLKYRVLK